MQGRPPVRDTLKELGLAPAKSRGQNFLKDDKVIAGIVQAIVNLAGGAGEILEIGPGLGALTLPLLETGARVTAVEFDRGLAENLAAAAHKSYSSLNVLHQDILTFDPAPLAEARGERLFVCGNLPYNISSPALLWFLRHLKNFAGAVFMLQKEMAERLAAAPGSKDYGRLTVALGLWCEVKKLFAVPPSAFHPRPGVESLVISLAPRPADETESLAVGPETVGRFTAVAFAARRKTIFNNLAKVYGRERSLSALAAAGVEPAVRAETLAPGTLAALAGMLEKRTEVAA